ncbi:MAG: DUF5683 domain-containing protein [Bacteroidales bacterium]|nr:DUF5683 domain-containing protein [Bacteroidales bacterium]
MERRWQNAVRCSVLAIGLMAFVGMDAQDTLSVNLPRVQRHREQVVRLTDADTLLVLPTDTLRDAVVIVPEEDLDATTDSLQNEARIILSSQDTLVSVNTALLEPQRWVPDPKKAMWLAIVFPGAGQIYNRKYWKLPLFYGGFLGCVYAISWNNTMYRDYSQAFIDIMDDDPNTRSYVNFLPRNYDAEANRSRLQELFRKKKDYYRRYRDLSIFATIGVYLLSILDAYIDAELSSFDISRDLSMKVRPSVINNDHSTALRGKSLLNSSYGIQCSISF